MDDILREQIKLLERERQELEAKLWEINVAIGKLRKLAQDGK